MFIACIDGLTGFKETILSVFSQTRIQHCVIHQIRSRLKYVAWKHKKPFMADLKRIYQAATREEAEIHLSRLAQTWSGQYAISVRSWQNNWQEPATMFDFSPEIRRLIYTTNAVVGYHRQLRKVIKNKTAFPTPEAARKILFLATHHIERKWATPIFNWTAILNQLAIRFEGRLPS